MFPSLHHLSSPPPPLLWSPSFSHHRPLLRLPHPLGLMLMTHPTWKHLLRGCDGHVTAAARESLENAVMSVQRGTQNIILYEHPFFCERCHKRHSLRCILVVKQLAACVISRANICDHCPLLAHRLQCTLLPDLTFTVTRRCERVSEQLWGCQLCKNAVLYSLHSY